MFRQLASVEIQSYLTCETHVSDFFPQVLAYFEFSAHALRSNTRCYSTLLLVDALVQSLSLTCIDAGGPRSNIFPAGHIASLPLSSSLRAVASASCDHGPLCFSWEQPKMVTRFRAVAEIRKEEIRRMMWGIMKASTLYTARGAGLKKAEACPCSLQTLST